MIQAILIRDLDGVKKNIDSSQINTKNFQCWIKIDDKAAKTWGIDNEIAYGLRYLSLAILNSTLDKNEADKKMSLQIIEELLKNRKLILILRLFMHCFRIAKIS